MADPAYLKSLADGRLDRAVAEAWRRMRACRLCPRRCGVDRTLNERGFCRVGKRAVVAGAAPHFGEESVLVGQGGSGTIFFSGCNLLCRFCQNWETSRCEEGSPVPVPALAELMLRLQAAGCANVNLVTPSHVVPQILSAVRHAARRGLRLPLVYNTGGYDAPETIDLLDGVVDIYMPDLKAARSGMTGRILHAPDYWEVACEAVRRMHRQVGDLAVGPDGLASRGLLVRHLVLPEGLADSAEVGRFLAGEISPDTYVNVMDQYRPVGEAWELPPLDRPVTREEYRRALEELRGAGLRRFDPGRTRWF